MSVAARFEELVGRIEKAAARVGRDPTSVRLVGAAKRQPLDRLRAALDAGLRDVGENYVQEAARKRDALQREGALPRGLRWHLIGGLQRNKARDAVALFDCVHSVDRVRLAQALDREAERAGRRLEVMVQVNLSGEPQKSGVLPNRVDELVEALTGCAALVPAGLMTIPAPSSDPEDARPAFAALRALRDRLRDQAGGGLYRELSMGMSADLEVAVEEGATRVRIGTALFGAREAQGARKTG